MDQTPFVYWRNLGLSVRAANALCCAGINSIEAAQSIDDETLHLEGHHVGRLTIKQIRQLAPYSPQPSAPHDEGKRRAATITRDAAMHQMREAGQSVAQIAETFGMDQNSVYNALDRHLYGKTGKRGRELRVPRVCAECGKPFMAMTYRATICSGRCQNARDMRKRGKHTGITRAALAERDAAIAQAWADGASLEQLTDRFGVSAPRISTALLRHRASLAPASPVTAPPQPRQRGDDTKGLGDG